MKVILGTTALGAALILAATAQYAGPSSPPSAPAAAPAATSASMTSKAVQIKLAPQNGSGEAGTATMMDGSKGLIVRVRLAGGTEGVAQPMHIHKGTCATLDPKPLYPLKNVMNGTSETTLPDVTLAQLQKSPYAINVHKSTSDIATYVSCGNVAQAK